MLYLPVVEMAPILWGALLAICGRHRSGVGGGNAQITIDRVGQGEW